MKTFGVLSVTAFAVFCLTSTEVLADGSVTGKVNLKEAKQPGRKKLNMAADPVCASKHTEAVRSEALLVNDGGTMRNVFVYVSKGVEGKKFDVPEEAAVLDQNGCIYQPRVLGVRAGQKINILNNDGTLHNVHPKPKTNSEFNQAMPKFMKKKTVSFDKAEVMVPVKCDVHPWMQGYVAVMDHPYYGVTGDGGTFELNGLPAGTYTITAWHEVFGSQAQEVTVTDGESASAEFTYALADLKKN